MRAKVVWLLLGVLLFVSRASAYDGLIGVLQGVDKDNVSDSVIKEADFFSIRASWKGIDKGTRQDWDWLDSQVARAHKYNKPFMLRIMAGENSPTWIGGAWYKGAPLPWNTKAIDAWLRFVDKLGARYRGDPLLYVVHLSCTANYSSAEMHLAPGLTNVKGYSDTKIIMVWFDATNAFAAAFPNTLLALNESIEPDSKGTVTYPVVENCKALLGGRAVFQHNSLKASTSPTAKHHQLILQLQKQGWRTGFQTACPSSNRDRFGGSFSEIFSLPGVNQAKYLEVYQGDI
jgi:hypothetical protein